MVRVGVLGATGYTGLELVRLLKRHPYVELTYLSSQSFADKTFSDVYPHANFDRRLNRIDLNEIVDKCDLVFTALPAGTSYEIAVYLAEKGLKVIDLGADFRFDDPEIYETWYGQRIDYKGFHRVYGLTELYRDEIRKADIVGNPGCYPTSVIIAAAPILKTGLWRDSTLIVDSKSGVSGAGRSSKLDHSFSEVNEAVKPYKVADHRHVPEMEQELSKLLGRPTNVVFTPQLVPITRGILSCIYLSGIEASLDDLLTLYGDFYKYEEFVHILPKGVYPSTKWVMGSNYAFISIAKDERTKTTVVLSVIDNLVKGASGQAVQNMNVLLGFDEKTGLDIEPLFP